MEGNVEMSQTIDSQQLLFAIQEGARRLINGKQELNKINVFPVADGDTGSNLASLMQTVLEETEGEYHSVKSVFEKVADASLIGARGNSGLIFAQYLNGIYNHMLTFDEPSSLQNFVKSAKAATIEACQAIENPIEGTIITVIRVWGEALSFISDKNDSISLEKLLLNALNEVKKAVENTTSQLKILQQNSVVDAGARGFYLFIEGFTQALINKEKVPFSNSITAEKIDFAVPKDFHEQVAQPVQRYCTEVLLSDVVLSKEEIQKGLIQFGDSIVVAVNRGKARIHIHSNRPEEVLRYLNEVGKPLQQKADDMLLQYEVNRKQKHSIALVTDSIADVPEEYLLDNQIHVLPMTLLIDTTSYIDKITVKSNQFFELLEKSQDRPTSSQPNIKTIENLFSFLETKYEQILVITVASSLSGTYRTIKEIAQKRKTKHTKIEVIDSQKNSAAEGLLVMQANKWLEEGFGFEELIEKVKHLRQQTNIFVSVDTLEPMIASGRIPKKVGQLAEWFNIKPVVSLDGEGNGKLSNISFSLAGTEQKIIKKIKQMNQNKQISSYAIVHGAATDRAEKLAVKVQNAIGLAPSYIMDISAVIALGAGKGSVGIALIYEEGK